MPLEEEDRGRLETDAQRRRDRKTRRGWSDAATSQGTSGLSGRDKGPSLGASGRSSACRPLDPAVLASRTGGRVSLCGFAMWLVVVCYDNHWTLMHGSAEARMGRPRAWGTWSGLEGRGQTGRQVWLEARPLS